MFPFRRVCFARHVESRSIISEANISVHATEKIILTRVLIYKSNSSWLDLPVAKLLSDFRLHVWVSKFVSVCVCPNLSVYAWLCRQVCVHLCLWERKRWCCVKRRRLQTDSVAPSVSPLNLNLPAPHGRSQPSMGLCFASKSRCRVPSERALLRQSLMCLFSTSHTSGCTGWSSSCCLYSALVKSLIN